MSKLVIVESPAKAKTIKKYLGPGFEVIASMGHIRDLPKTLLGVDVDHGFKPRYVDIPGKTALIRQLKSMAAESDGVILATDPDREGEAISWHLAQILKVDMGDNNRVTFNEITKTGVTQGMENPRTWIWSTPSRPAGFSTASWAISSARSFGKRCARACPPGGCSRRR